MTEPPEPRRPEEGGGDETDWAGMEQEAIRDFVVDHTPDMQEAIDAARAEYGDEQFYEMVAEVVRRVHAKNEAERLAREQLERVHDLTGNTDPVTEDEVQQYLQAAAGLSYTGDLEELAEDEGFEQLDDDITLDVLGSGDDIEDGGELTDLLGAWRDDVDSVPPSPGTAPETVQQIHDFTQEIDRATNPPRTTEGNDQIMSAQEDAERLRLIASSNDFPTPLIRAAHDAVDGILAQVLAIIGDTSQHRETVAGHAALAKDKCGEAIAAMIQFESSIHNAADGHARG